MHWNTYTTDLDIPSNWECTSYHHDELPSYQTVNGWHIWIDSHETTERELNTKNIIGSDSGLLPRFTVQTASSYNGNDDDHTMYFETDSFKELLEFVITKGTK